MLSLHFGALVVVLSVVVLSVVVNGVVEGVEDIEVGRCDLDGCRMIWLGRDMIVSVMETLISSD